MSLNTITLSEDRFTDAFLLSGLFKDKEDEDDNDDVDAQ
jgi:hypothetical protein